MTETLHERIERHPGMISVDCGETWYTPDELVAARETDWRVKALDQYRNERELPIDPNGAEYRDIERFLEQNGTILAWTANVVAEYVRRTGRTIAMNITYC